VLTTLAAQISVAIDNAQLYEQSQARARDMYFLFTVATAAAGAETLSETMHNVTVALQELLDAASATMYLPVQLTDGEQVRTELHPVASTITEMPLSEISQVRMEDTSNLLAVVAGELRPQIIEDVSAYPGYLPVVSNAQSAVIVPLAVGSRLVSVITMESLSPNDYSDDTLTLLLTLAGTLSAIVQNQQLLEELQRTNEKLLELDRIKSDFLANMSHELRTPLNSIIGFSRVILKGIDGPLTEMQEQDLTTIYNSGQHLLNLINDILDQAKIAAGKMDIQAEYFDIRPVIESVRSIGIGLVKDKPIDIVVHIAPGIPRVFGDEFRTRQVLLNLLSNAAKFTQEGSITISACAVDDEASGRTMIRADVADTGIGIAEKDMPLLFEAFRQVDSSLTKTQSGTGLGLPIAKSLIEMQGGRMEVQSKVNVGSTFTIYLPVEAPVEPARDTKEVEVVTDAPPVVNPTRPLDVNSLPPHIQEQLSQLGSSSAPVSQETEKKPVIPAPSLGPRPLHTKRQVLLIEDNPDMVDQFRRTLQRDGFDVYTASIVLEAEAMASGLNPTLIILDAHFANGGGWGILERLKQRDDTGDIPLIVVGLSDESDRAAALGAYCFIRKPFMPEVLSQAAKEAERDGQLNRILVIDDEPDSARTLQNLLGAAGKYRVYHAVNGVEGVSMVARRRPNLVILDLRMPETDGFGVIQELRDNPETAAIPIMVVTGETLNQVEIRRLSELQVIYKPDIEDGGAHRFAEVVKDQLTQINGERR
jgi:signal transduction histidine kinase/CheY-like chemotaxis protein